MQLKFFRFKNIGQFTLWVLKHFVEERCWIRASALTYTSLLALIPTLIVIVSVLSVFPAFSHVSKAMQDFVFSNFVPSTGKIIQSYLHTVLAQTRNLPTLTLVFLVVTAFVMLITIETTISDLWHIHVRRQWSQKLMLYWCMLTLGPILLGSSVALSSYVASIKLFAGIHTTAIQYWLKVLPFLLTILGFAVFYTVVPNCPVKLKHSFVGALVAAILFEFAKRLFGFYVLHFPTYEILYGALSTIPVFLIWVYLVWMIFMIGALVVRGLGEFEGEV